MGRVGILRDSFRINLLPRIIHSYQAVLLKVLEFNVAHVVQTLSIASLWGRPWPGCCGSSKADVFTPLLRPQNHSCPGIRACLLVSLNPLPLHLLSGTRLTRAQSPSGSLSCCGFLNNLVLVHKVPELGMEGKVVRW